MRVGRYTPAVLSQTVEGTGTDFSKLSNSKIVRQAYCIFCVVEHIHIHAYISLPFLFYTILQVPFFYTS